MQNRESIKLKKIDPSKDSEEEIARKLNINKDVKIYLNIKQELSLENDENEITVDIIALAKLLSNCYQMDF